MKWSFYVPSDIQFVAFVLLAPLILLHLAATFRFPRQDGDAAHPEIP